MRLHVQSFIVILAVLLGSISLLAITVLRDAQGGIAWLTDMSHEAYYVDQFFVDAFGLSTHPSPYARMCYLQEWQAQQNK